MFANLRDRPLRPLSAALAALGLASVAIIGAWLIEAMGYIPCELCLLGRKPYYAGVALAAATAVAVWRGRDDIARAGLALMALVFLAGAGIAAYHAGVELKFWPGPTACAGAASPNLSAHDFLEQLKRVKPVRCDEPALRLLGLSLADWSVFVSIVLSAIATAGALDGALPRRRVGERV